MLQTHGFIGV
jgi:anaphase-promoting complex subunit 6